MRTMVNINYRGLLLYEMFEARVDLSWDPQYQEAIRHEIDVFLVVGSQTPWTKQGIKLATLSLTSTP